MSQFLARLNHWARERSAQEAICDDTHSISYLELWQRIAGGADTLARAGVGEGTVVGLMIADEAEHLIATLSLLHVGAWQITLASHDTDAVREELFRRVVASHVVVDNRRHPPPDADVVPWQATAAAGESPPSFRGGMYFRTSGTTGGSNIVPVSDADLTLQSKRNLAFAGGRYLRPASVEHNNGKRHRLYNLYSGGTNILRPPSSQDLASYCALHSVDCLDISTMHAADLVRRAEGEPAFANIAVRVAGSAVPWPLRRELIERVSPQLSVRYASTETGTIAICGPEGHDEEESVGSPLEGIELEVVGQDGTRLPAGELGNVRIRGAGIVTGYHDDAEQGTLRFRDGWFWPGDIGYLRDDGSLVLKGRADEMMILNGINIFPSEIERTLETHPAVRAAAATGLKSAAHGEIPVAAVEVVQDVTTMELMTFARERLALRAPRRIVIVPRLPRTDQGKLLRKAVAALIDKVRK